MNPCKRKSFIKKLKNIGFIGPFSGSKHEFMLIENYRLAIPSNDEYSVSQLKMMIREIQLIIGREINNEELEKI